MKILLLSDINSSHTQKWAVYMAQQGIEVGIFTLSEPSINWKNQHPSIQVFSQGNLSKSDINSGFDKLRYTKVLPFLKKVICNFQPEILHAHYASSYGLLGTLCFFKPYVLSVWGDDVFTFPKKSWLHKQVLKFNLRRAQAICSTSEIMALETKKYTSKKVNVIPFGVDFTVFKPVKVDRIFEEKDIVIGTIKNLEKAYGLPYVIQAFKKLVEKYPTLPLQLIMVGNGSLREELNALCIELKIAKRVTFTGTVPYSDIWKYHNMIDIFVNVSIFESFGVSVVEAMACCKPTIVTDVGGLKEVVEDGITGFRIPQAQIEPLVQKMELLLDPQLRMKMGKKGYEKAIKKYNIVSNFEQLLFVYKQLLKK